MLRITKNEDKLEIKNVICFFVGEEVPSSYDEVKKIKEEDWSYQDYLTMSCGKHKYNLYWFNKAFVQFQFDGEVINIDDPLTDAHISLDKDNIHDTIIFQGQANDEPGVNYEGLMRAFEYMHFYMINTFDEIRMASDKMLSANLLSSKDIPQPKYILVTKNIMQDPDSMTGSTRESFWKLLDTLYDDNPDIGTDQEIKYVVKILGGSLGIGVFICTKDELEAILQTIFELDEERELMIQAFKKNTGDIRAHAFSVDGKVYEIIACMKRNKIDKDFRSNVSLGATTQEIDLTDEQKEIILKTAQLSHCRWVGVDLMDCEDGSNVVIEYNSSPGVQGISQQIKKNMFDVVMDKINDYFKNYKDKDLTVEEYAKHTHAYVQYDPEAIENLKKTEWENISEYRKKIMDECLTFVPGTQYKLHGKDNPCDGLDCSGYVKRVFKESLDMKLPDMCVEYFQVRDIKCIPINKKQLKPGDIGILNNTTKNNHMGIYAGDGKWFENSVCYGVQLTNNSSFKFFFNLLD